MSIAYGKNKSEKEEAESGSEATGSAREAELLDLLDQTTEMICTSNPDGQITYANESWQRTLGYTLSEAMELRPVELVAPEQRSTYVELARRLHLGEAVEEYEAVLIAKDGRRVVCRGRASARIVGGTLIEVRAIYRDVTTERGIEGMRSRLVATLEATSDFVGIATREGDIVFLNRSGRRLLGLSERDDLSRLRTDGIHPPDELERLAAHAVPTAVREGRWEGESRLLSLSGDVIPVSIVIVAHPSVRADEPPYFLSMVMRDLRDRVRIEEALRKSIDEERRVQSMKDQLIGTVSHELRSPLGAIRSALQLLSRRLEDPDPRVQQMLDIAIRNTDGLLRLTKGLLDIERVESGTLPMELAPVSMHVLIPNAIGIMQHAADIEGVTLQGGNAGPELFVMADADRIMQVLMNLLSNAIKFSPRDSTITVTALADDREARVSVADQGRGIPADKLESIFERFEQVDAGDARDKGGAGIGLAICRAIVLQHGGRIWAESGSGRGSLMQFTLPLATAP